MSEYYICEGCEKIKIKDESKYKHHIILDIGQIIKIDDIPYEYLGFGILGTNNKKVPEDINI